MLDISPSPTDLFEGLLNGEALCFLLPGQPGRGGKGSSFIWNPYVLPGGCCKEVYFAFVFGTVRLFMVPFWLWVVSSLLGPSHFESKSPCTSLNLCLWTGAVRSSTFILPKLCGFPKCTLNLQRLPGPLKELFQVGIGSK